MDSHRRLINESSHRLRTGMSRRVLPVRLGPWKPVYERHGRWSADGAWDKTFAAVLADAQSCTVIDSDWSPL
ncbi:transposase [Streptomyces sp. NBC_00316]|uniref:transposase n=1 Tax=Streptomyces sp. NBC_00316 TaxID=2975710 RepID=UPI003FA6E580